MSSLWNKNITLFVRRFPQLAEQLGISAALPCPRELPFTIDRAKSGGASAMYNGMRLHSAYNPEREAQGAVAALSKQGADTFSAGVFEGFGLGYLPREFALRHPDKTLIVIEPDTDWLLAAFTALDWSPVLALERCIFCIRAAPESVIQLLEHQGLRRCAFLGTAAYRAHAAEYFSAVQALVTRNRRKDALNENTLNRFSALWTRNICRNLGRLSQAPGISAFQDAAGGRASALPFTVLAAGPSLRRLAPYLAEMKRRSVLVATDTAVRLCLEQGVEPDFIVIMDPQYWAWRHIAGLSAPGSILITESAVYPAVLRFPCRQILMASPMFPVGRWFEARCGKKGELAAGGSVSTSAWDFARRCGAARIYLAGLDLGFPGGLTHYRGCTFEEKAHALSGRLHPAETDGTAGLFSADAVMRSDYTGKALRSDARMSMFAWWFESEVSKAAEKGCVTCTLSTEGMAIPGILPAQIQDFLALPRIGDTKRQFIEDALSASRATIWSAERFGSALEEFLRQLRCIGRHPTLAQMLEQTHSTAEQYLKYLG